jgi:nitrite reductase (NADH) small subunit
MTCLDIGPLTALPERGARCVRVGDLKIAAFRTSSGEVFALRDHCPHRGGPLSQGIVHGTRVTCPLHDWVIDLTNGHATGADEGATATFAVHIVDGRVVLELPAELLAKAS